MRTRIPVKALKTMEAFEKAHLLSQVEHAIVVDTGGRILFQKVGASDELTFTQAEIEQMAGAYLSHNHPAGNSFSPSDFRLLLTADLAAIRAIGRNQFHQCYVHTLENTTRGGNHTPAEVEAWLLQYKESFESECYAKLYRKKLKHADFEANFWHWVSEKGAQHFGFDYHRRRTD